MNSINITRKETEAEIGFYSPKSLKPIVIICKDAKEISIPTVKEDEYLYLYLEDAEILQIAIEMAINEIKNLN